MEIMTGGGLARAELDGDGGDGEDNGSARFLLVLTHGAGAASARLTCWPPGTPRAGSAGWWRRSPSRTG
jgi:hypothetical protein